MKDFLSDFRDDHHEFNVQSESINANDPFELFKAWFQQAAETKEREPNAFVLTTSTSEGQSSARILYLKEILDHQFVFYTNYNSLKGRTIAENPKVSMLFFWPGLSRQIRIEGICTKTSEMVSDAYFNSRPRGSQIGAWASEQSDVLDSREELENRVKSYEEKFQEIVPRPLHWGGYQVEPKLFEFWQGRPSRLHDRLIFERSEDKWSIVRKNP